MPNRLNSYGADVNMAADRGRLEAALEALDRETVAAGPIVSGRLSAVAFVVGVQSRRS